MTSARQFALMEGHTTYEGRPCPVCSRYAIISSSTRYTSSGNCVACKRRDNSTRPDGTPCEPMTTYEINERMMSTEMRRISIECGSKEYDGKPCKKCGSRSRYTTNGACVRCTTSRANADRARRYAATHEPQPQPFSLAGRSRCEHAEIFSRMEYLGGHDVRYVRCDIVRNIMDNRPALGRCVLCHPNQLITFFNSYNARQIHGLDQMSIRILYDLCGNDQLSGVPGRSVASLCLAAKAERRGTQEQPAPALPQPEATPAPARQLLTMPLPLALPGEDTDAD